MDSGLLSWPGSTVVHSY